MNRHGMKAWLYLLPALLFLSIFMIYPLIDVFVYSAEEGYNLSLIHIYAWVYCTQRIAPWLCENLTKVKHTNVRCETAAEGMEAPVREPERVSLIISSERADAILAKLYQLSRNQSLERFRTKKVYINGRLCENNSCQLKSGDMVSARGYGRFLYYGAAGETRKGRLNAAAGVYR